MDNVTETLNEIAKWPVQDRLELVYQVWDQLSPEEVLSQVDDHDLEEVERRIEAYEADPSLGRTWDQLIEYLNRDRK